MIIGFSCFVVERSFPGWKLPRVKTWAFRVLLLNVAQLGVILLAGISWEKWLNGWSLVQLGSFGLLVWFEGFIAYFLATFIFYWWHRYRHESPVLWRLFHQIHHSPQRIEVITSFYKHPIEMVINSILGSLIVFAILGLSLEGAAYYTFFTAIGEFFYHTNVNTPQWLGYIFQRPEMHRYHHEYQQHKSNYGDIVWWDILFGTYRNPVKFESTCGFDDEKEQRLAEMLAWEDVHHG
ncbi:MAG: sterol desaturase family protein [Bdellovibrionales bacterium]|nr:sterol desaturase family protein [Bdellovibrionales bacterium]